MAGGPLYWFRKNQKILLVVFGVLLMIVFTVGGVLDSFFSGQNQGGSPVRKVASTSFGDFTNQDLDEFAEANRRAAEFTFELYRLSKDPMKAKAVPISPLNTSSTEARDRDILSRLAFAEFAKENGMYVGDEILNDYFNMLCNNELANVNKTVEQFSRELQRGSLSTVKAHLKTELLARVGQQLISAGVNPQYSQQGFLVGVSPTPVEIWEGNRRLRERFKIQYMTIDVATPDTISEGPTDEEMRKLYEEGMDRAPNLAIGPGFKKPRLATVAYFAVNRENFLEAEKAKITEQEIRTKYQEWVENEDFRVIDTTGLGTIDGGEFQPGKGNDDATKKDDSEEAPKLNSPSNEKSKSDDPEADKSKESKSPKAPGDSDEKSKKKPDTNTPKKSGEEKKQSAIPSNPQGMQFVSLIQEKGPETQDPKKQDPKKQETKKETPEKGSAKTETQKTETPKSTPGNNDPGKNDPGKNDPGKQEKSTGQPEKGAPSSVPPKSVQDDQEKNKPKIKPLDDKLRDVIKTELARPKADKAVEEALEAVKTVVADYLNDYDYYTENPDEKDYLEVPNFEELAGQYGLMFKQYTQIDYKTLSKTSFGKAAVIPTNNRRQAGNVAGEIFFATFQTSSNFEINSTRESEGLEYIFWVTDRKYREKLTFDEAKPKIVEYFKRMKAVEAAKAKAENIATEVAAENKTLSAVYGDQVKTSQEFGWMEIDENMERMAAANPQIVQQMPQFFTPKMGQIIPEAPDQAIEAEAKPEEGVDHGVMSKIFALEENEIGYAVDSAKERVFVFQVTERIKASPMQKEDFFTQGKFGTAQAQSQLDQGPALTDVLSAMELLEKYSVKWYGERKND